MTEIQEAAGTQVDASEPDAAIAAVPPTHYTPFPVHETEPVEERYAGVDLAKLDAPVEEVHRPDVAQEVQPISIAVPTEPGPLHAAVQDTSSPQTVTSGTGARRARQRKAAPKKPAMKRGGRSPRPVDPGRVGVRRRLAPSKRGREATPVYVPATSRSVEVLRQILLDLAVDVVDGSARPQDLINVVARLDRYIDRIIAA
jgi:hypothetical protein